jgi:hypothetical protein
VNNGTLGQINFDYYNGITPSVADALSSGVIRISSDSDALHQGRIKLATYGSGVRLEYTGAKWADVAQSLPPQFNLNIEEEDIVWYAPGSGFDLSAISLPLVVPPNTPTGPTYEYSGGSKLQIKVFPLVSPEVASVSPTVLAGGATQDITVTLKRPLHPTQTPTVAFQSASGLLTFNGAPRVNKNASGGIVSWTISVTASSSAASSVAVTMTAQDAALHYLSGDVIVTQAYNYTPTPINLPAMSISKAIATQPLAITSVQAVGPDSAYGVAATDGWTATASGQQAFAGKIVVTATVSSPANNFSSGSVIAKATGTTARITLGTASLKGSPYVGNNSSGTTLYYQDYYMVVDTGLLLTRDQSYDIGFSAVADGVTTTSWINNVFVNQNLTKQFTSYNMTVNFSGAASYTAVGIPASTWVASSTGTSGAVPSLNGGASFGIQELWGYKSAGASFDSILKQELRVTGPGKTDELVKSVTARDPNGYLEIANVDTSAWTAGYYDFVFRIYSKATTYSFDGVNQGYIDTPAQSFRVAHSTGGGGGCFAGKTYVMTVDGPKTIDSIKVDALVMSASDVDFQAGNFTLTPKKTLAVLVHDDRAYETVNLNGILTTPEHPWATSDREFTEVSEMTDASLVMSVDILHNETYPVSAIQIPGPDLETVYNLTIEDTHTYLVAPSIFGPWYLVHNAKKIEYKTLWDMNNPEVNINNTV